MRAFDLLPILALALSSPALAQSGPLVNETEIPVSDKLPGAFFAVPEGDGPFPAIIILGGSEGGDRAARSLAKRFLAQDYAVLGLPYYSPAWAGNPQQFPGLPKAFANIPVDMAETARDWLKARKDVRAEDIAIYGVSKGAEFALLAGSKIDGFAAIAAIVPSDVVWEGWGPGTSTGKSSSFSWRGEPLEFVPYSGMEEEIAKFAKPGETARLRLPHDRGRNANPLLAVKARIKVTDIDEPVLVAGGDADNVWNSGEMAQAIAERRAEARLPTVSLVFTDAGHSLSGTGKPNEYSSDEEIAAQKIIWPATLDFFATHLKD
ncbi:MAG: acyl-CoA thioester hydrolase/BAAT C-terminal domain-containing protein [Pseudomonadota bacterium]